MDCRALVLLAYLLFVAFPLLSGNNRGEREGKLSYISSITSYFGCLLVID